MKTLADLDLSITKRMLLVSSRNKGNDSSTDKHSAMLHCANILPTLSDVQIRSRGKRWRLLVYAQDVGFGTLKRYDDL
jgi:hypothetical protein